MAKIHFSRSLLVALGASALFVCGAAVHAQQAPPAESYDSAPAYAGTEPAPGRVARLAYQSGDVEFAPAGENEWSPVDVNRPLVIGDRLLTGDDGRAVLELGDASIRIDNDSAFDFLNLDAGNVQIELSEGTLNMAVRQLNQGANFEVDTPTIAFVAASPGIYRIDNDPTGTGSMVTVFRGSGTVYGENGTSRPVEAGRAYRFNDSTLASVDETGLPPPDDFDRFCEARDAAYARYAQQEQQYTPPDMIGGEELSQYGQWDATPEYGNVWYPTSVPSGWAPYRYGHWAWIDPWGWTWVDNQPWGFAPFHYGRWAYVRNRWGWVPGPVGVRPVYAPALVAFVGGSGLSVSVSLGGGGPVGWFPLGPRDVYVPWFHASRNYFTRVNVTNIRNVYVNRTLINNYYNDYRAGRRPPFGRNSYAYRRMPDAVTAVPRNVFTGARPVHPAVLRLNRTQLARTEIALRPGVNPGRASLGLRKATPHPAVLKGRDPFTRAVVARHEPPPRPVAFATRERIIAGQHGRPLSTAQVQRLRTSRSATPTRDVRVKLVPKDTRSASNLAARGTAPRTTPPRPVEPQPRSSTGRAPEAPFRNTVHPIPARNQPPRDVAGRPGELPSARYAHPGERGALPRVPVIRAAREVARTPLPADRLPAVKPVERAPRTVDNRAAPRPRSPTAEARQRAQRTRDQQVQRQRQTEAEAQQRVRDQAAPQPRALRMPQQRRDMEMQRERLLREPGLQGASPTQVQQRTRAQQMQRQRQTEAQAQQRMRDQAIQQQRQPQQRAVEVPRGIQRAPESRGRAAPARREPPSRRPPPASGHGARR